MKTYLPMTKPGAFSFCYSLTLLLAAAQAGYAGGVVTNNTEAALRAALAGGGLVTFATSGTIVLTNTLSISNSTIMDATGHTVAISGGNAVRVFEISTSGALTLSNLTVANGWNQTAGGFFNSGSLTLVNCTVSSNTAYSSPFGAGAGGILNAGTLFANGCTFVGNIGSTNSIASTITIHQSISSGASMSLVNCTFFGNSMPALPSGNTIYQSGNKPSFILNCTIAGRVGYNPAGTQPPGSMTLRNTIAYGTSGDTNSSNNLIDPNPGLGPLANNGGPTLTMALLPDSLAINAANAAYAPATDQRGFVRPYGAGHDIGAFETVFIGTNAGVMRFTSSTYDVLQTNGSATITVYRDHGATGTVSVQFATSDGTAIAGQDYTATNGTLTFSSGELSKSFVVPINTQPAALTTKTVNLTLSNPTGGATLGSPSVGSLNIVPTVRLITSNDENALRSAMAGGGVLLLAFDGTMTLTSPLTASTTVALDASGHDVTISGANLTRLFNVQPGVMLSLNNLTLADGMARGTNGVSGSNGESAEGGAIYSDNGIISARNCCFVRNSARGGDGGDGGVGSGGSVYLKGGAFRATDCVFTLNSAHGGTGGPGLTRGGHANGGSICSLGGTVQLTNSIVSSNTAVAGEGRRFSTIPGTFHGGEVLGGAICTTTGEVWVVRSILSANSGRAGKSKNASGGAIHQNGGSTYIVASVMELNQTTGGAGFQGANMSRFPGGAAYGGAVSIAAGAMWLTNSTLSGNLALGGDGDYYGDVGSGLGGGVFNSATLQAVNTTIFGNIARSGKPGYSIANQGSGLGGGLYNNSGSIVLDYVTISGNSAEQITGGTAGTGSALGGGIHSTNGITTLHGSIVANSLSGSNAFGTLVDGGYNLSSDSSCNFTNTGSLNNVNPLLYPLGDFGGPTPTMPLLAGSPAIDAGDPSAATSVDQRGVPRPYGLRPDMGAYEWNGTGPVAEAPAILINPQPATVFVGGSVALSVTAQGYQPLQYSWRRDGSVLAGANGTTYSFSNALASQSGAYTVVVTNIAGAITSAPALIRVKSVQLYSGNQMLTNGSYQFASPPTLTIRSAFTNGASFYTLDGSTPSFNSTYYSGPFVLSQSATVRAIGYSADFSQSDIADTVYADVLVNHTLTFSTTSGGTVSLNPPGGTYIATNIVTATAQPAAGWYFLYWLGDASGANPSVNVSMERDKAIHAVFGTTLSTTVAGSGTIQVWPPGGVHPLGTTICLTAIPQPGNYFGFWGNAATGNTNPLYFTITGPNQTVSSIFAPLPADQSALTVLINGRGRVNANPRANAYATNQSVTLTAVPDAGQTFLNWSGDASGTQNPLVVSMAQSRVITANFSSRPWLRVDRPGVEGLTPAGFRLTVVSDPQTSHEIRSSTNLATWVGLGRVTNHFGEVQFTDTNAVSLPTRFYQAAP